MESAAHRRHTLRETTFHRRLDWIRDDHLGWARRLWILRYRCPLRALAAVFQTSTIFVFALCGLVWLNYAWLVIMHFTDSELRRLQASRKIAHDT